MIKYIIHIILLLFILSCVSRSKISKNPLGKYRKYVEEKYEITSASDIHNYNKLREIIGLKNGEIIADVGAADGYHDIMLSLLTDSVTYYIQDISKENMNEANFDSLKKFLCTNRTSPSFNKFHFILGNYRQSLLPDTIFDKIFLFNSLHEFIYVKDMMDDLYLKLKHKGKIIIKESLSDAGKVHIIEGCNTVAYTKNDILKILRDSGFNADYKQYSDSTFGNILIFSKK